MNYQDNQIEKPHWTTKFLWWCAGADNNLLAVSPMQDRVKYAGIGGIVLCTGLLASFSGGYAFLTIFGPKGNAINPPEIGLFTWLITIVFGIIWGLIIFNLDRFIVSSTGKGDGTDSITWKEVGQAFPRIIIALILGIAISKPLEIRILKSEIDIKVNEYQRKAEADLNKLTDSVYIQKQKTIENQKAEYEEKLAKYETELKVYSDQIDILTTRAQAEEDGSTGRRGTGKVSDRFRLDIENKKIEKNKFIELKRVDIENWRKQLDLANIQIKKDIEELNAFKKENKRSAEQSDGLLRRIQIGDEISGMVKYVILFVLLSIEMGPIFFKMMMTKGVYDFMVENNNHKRNVENGIYREDFAYEGKDGLIHLEKYRFLEVENAKLEKEQKMKSLAILNQETIIGWEKIKSEAIKKDPSKFFTEGDESIRQNNA